MQYTVYIAHVQGDSTGKDKLKIWNTIFFIYCFICKINELKKFIAITGKQTYFFFFFCNDLNVLFDSQNNIIVFFLKY